MVPAVSAKIHSLVSSGKWVKVNFSRWASPCLGKKKDGSYQVVVDLKRSINKWLKVDVHHLLKLEVIFATLSGGVYYCVLDPADAYTQLALDEESQDLFTIKTHKGLFRSTRLLYGAASAPAIFQNVMDTVLQNISNVCCYLDDRIIQGSDFQSCLRTVHAVLKRLNDLNVRLRQDKCIWFAKSVEHLGHEISAEGRSPSKRLTEAIINFKSPNEIKSLRSYRGLLNFYSFFCQTLARY